MGNFNDLIKPIQNDNQRQLCASTQSFIRDQIQQEIIKIARHIIEACQSIISGKESFSDGENQISESLEQKYNSNTKSIKLYQRPKKKNENGNVVEYDFETDFRHIPGLELGSHFSLIIECKKLDGDNLLNRNYIKLGMNRFFDPQHESYYHCKYQHTHIMIGYIIKPGIDINENNNKINDFLKVHLRPEYTDKQKLIQVDQAVNKFNYEFVYCSSHSDCLSSICITNTNLNNQLKLYHIFIDFSNNIIKGSETP